MRLQSKPVASEIHRPQQTMKGISINQPYAWLICLPETDPCVKRVENRTWTTGYRGPLAIHAGKSRKYMKGYEDEMPRMSFGAVVAVAELCEIVTFEAINQLDSDLMQRHPWLVGHVHALGPYCWILRNVRPIQPVPMRGRLGLWDIPDSLIQGG